MTRNHDIRTLFTWMTVISICGIVGVSLISLRAMWFVLILVLCFFVIVFVYILRKCQEIKDLSQYIRQISNGNYSLDIRDNKEGELSILKNEIYKVTSRLAEQSAYLQQDKLHLVTALSDISHQLKTPLASMTVMADLLANPNLPPKRRSEFLENIHTQLDWLDWLVSSLLTLSKIDAGAVHFRSDEVYVKTLVEYSVEAMSIPLDMNEQTVEIKGNDHVTFTGDFDWTAEALTNILKNCIEHSPKKSSIIIYYKANVIYTEIQISDSGKGIPKNDLPYIFQRFYKGEHASKESIGIGLAMAHQIITSQGGTIEAHSNEGYGTTFCIRFYHQKPFK